MDYLGSLLSTICIILFIKNIFFQLWLLFVLLLLQGPVATQGKTTQDCFRIHRGLSSSTTRKTSRKLRSTSKLTYGLSADERHCGTLFSNFCRTSGFVRIVLCKWNVYVKTTIGKCKICETFANMAPARSRRFVTNIMSRY